MFIQVRLISLSGTMPCIDALRQIFEENHTIQRDYQCDDDRFDNVEFAITARGLPKLL